MARLVWGKAQQLCFEDEHEYYQALGSLCRQEAYTITFETNSDTESWGDAFRIKCLLSDTKTPDAFIHAMKTARRINCNDYVQHLYEHHNFDFNVGDKVLIGSYNKVKSTVPAAYHQDFDDGYSFKFTRYSKFTKPSTPHTNGNGITPKPTTKPKPTFTPAPKQAPPKPLLVSVGDTVIHKSFGRGTVYATEGVYIKVRFSGVGEKTFKNPDAFTGNFLKKV